MRRHHCASHRVVITSAYWVVIIPYIKIDYTVKNTKVDVMMITSGVLVRSNRTDAESLSSASMCGCMIAYSMAATTLQESSVPFSHIPTSAQEGLIN